MGSEPVGDNRGGVAGPAGLAKAGPLFSGSLVCHRNFGPENFGPLDQNFQWKIGPPGPKFSGNLVLVEVRIIQDSLLVYQLYDIIRCLLEIIVA